MKSSRFGIFRRISILVFALITGMSLLFIFITYLSATRFYNVTTQRLNKDVATHIAKFASPFEANGINKQIADSVFYNAMVISPSIEVYFLDTTGKVMYFQSPDSAIRLWQIPLEPIKKYIHSGGTKYVTSPDPKEPEKKKVFSAAEVINHSKRLGYIYVVLGGKEYGNVSEMLFNSHVGGLALKAFVTIILLSLLISIYYINRLQKNYKNIISVLEQYQAGDFTARFNRKGHNEFAPVTESFNRMAELISDNVNRLRHAEKERKDFIATISHDLRTPLSVARGYTETLLNGINEQKISPQQEIEYAQLVYKKIDQVEKMVIQLFELSKMESPETAPVLEPFIFSEVLEELVKSYQIAAEEKNIRLSCIGCHDMYWVYADIRLMERVIQNLLDNAIKHTPENGTIRVELKQDKDKLIASFYNSGNPLPVSLVQWINQQDNSEKNTRPNGSKGLGLSIVKKILSLHQFSFHIDTFKEGNSFSFYMDLHTTK